VHVGAARYDFKKDEEDEENDWSCIREDNFRGRDATQPPRCARKDENDQQAADETKVGGDWLYGGEEGAGVV
jgi:hypothetical protein